MNSHTRTNLVSTFEHIFDGCDLSTLETLRKVYNKRAANPKLPALDRDIAQVQIEAMDPFIRHMKDPRHTKHPFQG